MKWLLLGLLCAGLRVFADEAKTADDIIHNDKLRAETGSTSKWSVATSLTYNGASIEKPFADHRPNIQEVNGLSSVSDIEGGISVKYNVNARDSLLLGETFRYITPLSSLSKTPAGYKGQKADSYNPSLNYQRIYNLGQADSYFQVGPQIYTQSDLTKIGYLGNLWIYNVNAWQIGRSRYTVGLETNLLYGWYRKPQAYPEFAMSERDTRDQSTDWMISAYPYLEVQLTDEVSLRTSGMYFSREHTLSGKWNKSRAIQTLGLGFSITRDIYINPEIQFIPDQIRARNTNFALISSINLF